MSDDARKTEDQWRALLDADTFQVTRKQGTERAFTGKYHDCKTAGIYHCACCDAPLFGSTEKYDSGSGWPSYWQPLESDAVRTVSDSSHGMQRVEVLCARCDAHLGHVFEDGPPPTGQRYCINSISLNLKENKPTDR